MSEPAALYVGSTAHNRFGPRPHRFRYSLFQVLVDVDRPDAFTRLAAFRLGLFGFSARDHGARDGSSLRAWAEQTLRAAAIPATAARIRLLAFPRVLGFVFNPISCWFVENAAGSLEAVIYEVNNTFGQTHAYAAPASGTGVQRQQAGKALYVSPFFRVEGDYRFKVTPPGAAFHLDIVKAVDGRPDFTAGLHLQRVPLTDARLLALFLGMPLMTLGAVAAIHWQALRLWLKGAPFGHRAPGPQKVVSAGVNLLIRHSSETGVMLPLQEDAEERADHGARPLVPAPRA